MIGSLRSATTNGVLVDPGMSARKGAIASGLLGNLKVQALGSNQIGDAAMTELSRAIASGADTGMI